MTFPELIGRLAGLRSSLEVGTRGRKRLEKLIRDTKLAEIEAKEYLAAKRRRKRQAAPPEEVANAG